METNMEKNLNNFRFEKKFISDNTRLYLILFELKSNGFFKTHPERIINSIYFDDINLKSYYENLDGLSNRKKYRFRFYGDFTKNIQGKFEKKIKRGDVNYKLSQSHSVSLKNLYKINFPHKPNLYLNIHTKYKRYYFYNRLKKVRCTIDVGLKIINAKNKLVKHFNKIIIEFKCDKKTVFNNIIKSTNYNVRCSKYCIGIDLHNMASENY